MKKLANFIVNDLKIIIISLLIILSFFIFDLTVIFVLMGIFGIDYNNLPIGTKAIILSITNITYMALLIFIFRKDLIKDLKDFKKNGFNYLKKYFLYYVFGVCLMALSNILISKITGISRSGNEDNIRNYIHLVPIFMLFSTVIYSPVVEELIFRKTIKDCCLNKKIFIVISGIVFGLLHVSNFKDINQLLFSIPYILIGLDFAYIYYKTNNIFTTITFHSFHNLILFLIQIIFF